MNHGQSFRDCLCQFSQYYLNAAGGTEVTQAGHEQNIIKKIGYRSPRYKQQIHFIGNDYPLHHPKCSNSRKSQNNLFFILGIRHSMKTGAMGMRRKLYI